MTPRIAAVVLVASALMIYGGVVAIGEDDLVKNLPGLIFKTNFKTYSGYLNASADGTKRMHYWLVESKNDPTKDPILVWFNGGPGCSSFAGILEELGPFYVNKDGETLYENVYSWNARANVLALESPIGVGFSYDQNMAPNDNQYFGNDSNTCDENYAALADFFGRVQKDKYGTRSFFLSGESYAGIYIPTLAAALIDGINAGTFPNPNFAGAAIGNGFMNVPALMNSLVVWSNYHGRVSLEDWNKLQDCCRNGTTEVISDWSQCDWYRYLTSKNGIDMVSDGSECGNLTGPLLVVPDQMDPYNFYQDCYAGNAIEMTASERRKMVKRQKSGPSGPLRRVRRAAVNTATLLNRDSTDNQNGYPCWNEDAVQAWSNRKDVQQALNIAPDWQNRTMANQPIQWVDCNDHLYNTYHLTYNTTGPFFDRIIKNNRNPAFRILVYNGDVDTVCNYLGDSWHIQAVAKDNGLTSTPRTRWWFRDQVAGFTQRYNATNITIDVLTVKGAGHFVPNDRPGPSCQMITNFILAADYSDNSTLPANPQPAGLLSSGVGAKVLTTLLASLVLLVTRN